MQPSFSRVALFCLTFAAIPVFGQFIETPTPPPGEDIIYENFDCLQRLGVEAPCTLPESPPGPPGGGGPP